MEALIVVAVLFIFWTQRILMTPNTPPPKKTSGFEDLARAFAKVLEAEQKGENQS
jgi:hypothetical protein